MFVALSIPDWPTGAAARELPPALLAIAPRVALAPQDHLAWLDARGLDPAMLAQKAIAAIARTGIAVGIAAVPCVAAIAAEEHAREAMGHGPEQQAMACILPGTERAFLASLPLDVLKPDLRLLNLFHGVGLACCGDLARLPREAVEVRFGPDGVAAWRLARADDPRPIFTARPRDLPNASLDWTEFSTSDVEQLVFVLHSLLKTVCDVLMTTGLGTRALTLTLTLENRTTLVHPVGAARVTAQRTTWLRLMRRALERITLPDRVTGIAVQVDSATTPTIQQGDLFDLGFASALAAESAIGQIMDLQDDAVVEPVSNGHVLLERRVKWMEAEVNREEEAMDHGLLSRSRRGNPGLIAEPAVRGSWLMASCSTPRLTAALHPVLLPTPREITVLTQSRRGFDIPRRYTDNGVTVPLTECLGPHCVSGEHWDTTAFAREYFQGVRADGVLVLLYRDVVREQWYFSGWWD